jgi:molybdopterin biosynthesis enzyme
MISVDEALERILGYVSVLEPEEKPILQAMGQVLAEDVASPFSIPPLDNTAMDGYAVQAASTAGASPSLPVELEVVGELAAGYLFEGQVGAGQAVRIMTGAPIPAGADAIVPFEETEEAAHRAPSEARVSRRRCAFSRRPGGGPTSVVPARTSARGRWCCGGGPSCVRRRSGRWPPWAGRQRASSDGRRWRCSPPATNW